MKLFSKLLFLFVLSLVSGLSFSKDIIYMGQDIKHEPYQTHLLNEVFKHAQPNNFEAKHYDIEIPHHRAFLFLTDHQVSYLDEVPRSNSLNTHRKREIDIVFAYATKEREEKYLAIPIPILKGLYGWRLPLVHKDNVDMFKDVKELEAFKKFSPGSHNAWTDNIILSANGIKTTTGSNFIGLYYMLDKKRFDYFPRRLLDIYQESAVIIPQTQTDLIIEPHLLIIYPTAVYMYVAKNNLELANTLETGIEVMIANGLFDDIFYRYFGEKIMQLRNENRQVLRLTNPTLPASVPLNRPELWVNY